MKCPKCKTPGQIISELKIKLRSAENLAASIEGENEEMRTALKRISALQDDCCTEIDDGKRRDVFASEIAEECLKSVS